MGLEVEDKYLKIIPVDEQDKAYIREVLGLKNPGDSIKLVRVDESTQIRFALSENELSHMKTEPLEGN